MKFYSCLKVLFVIACVFCSRSQSLNAQFLGTMTAGHADIGVGFANNNLEPHIHADTALSLFGGGTLGVGEYEANQVWFGIGDSLITTRSTTNFGGSQYNFLGVNSGQNFWLLPATNVSNRIGFSAAELKSADGWGQVTFTLNSITPKAGTTGSSQFSAWNELGGNIVEMITTTSGFPINKSFFLNPENHTHFNMAFTGPGIFEVAFTVSASRTQGTTTTPFSATESFTFAVGNANFTAVPEPSSFALIATLSSVGAAWRYRKRLGSKISRN